MPYLLYLSNTYYIEYIDFGTTCLVKPFLANILVLYVFKGWVSWPVSVVCGNSIPDIESVTEALKTGPYGRCVYECDNDVCSNQVGQISIILQIGCLSIKLQYTLTRLS